MTLPILSMVAGMNQLDKEIGRFDRGNGCTNVQLKHDSANPLKGGHHRGPNGEYRRDTPKPYRNKAEAKRWKKFRTAFGTSQGAVDEFHRQTR